MPEKKSWNAINDTRTDVARIFFDELERAVMTNTVPRWVAGYTIVPHHNPIASGKPTIYRGFNTLRLAIGHIDAMQASQSITGDPRWATFNQMKRMRAGTFERLTDKEMVENQYRRMDDPNYIRTWGPKKGSHGVFIEYWGQREEKKNINQDNQEAKTTNPTDAKEKQRSQLFGSVYKVFNFALIDGAPPIEVPAWRVDGDALRYDAAFRSLGIRVTEDPADTPSYSPIGDYISMPLANGFKDFRSYIHSLCHEFIHSTGHASRLNRMNEHNEDAMGFSGHARPEEEMIAELGTMMLMARMGFEPMFDTTIAYVLGWKKRCADPHVLPRAMRAAQEATDYIVKNIRPEFQSIFVNEDASIKYGNVDAVDAVGDLPSDGSLSLEAGRQDDAIATEPLKIPDPHMPLSKLITPF